MTKLSKKGGKGNVATTVASANLDKGVRHIGEELANELGFEWKQTVAIPGMFTPKGKQKNMNFDGGAFYLNGELVAAVEAKHNGKLGNAIERWYKNNTIVRDVAEDISYITFASGAVEYCDPIQQILGYAHTGKKGSINTFDINKNSLFLSKEFQLATIKTILKNCLLDIIANN